MVFMPYYLQFSLHLPQSLPRWASKETDELEKQFQIDSEKGFNADEIESRLEQYGPKQLVAKIERSDCGLFFDQFKSINIWILNHWVSRMTKNLNRPSRMNP
jgi:magnesium-transporting ATPase (P-type)